jgi:selenophosphate synthase
MRGQRCRVPAGEGRGQAGHAGDVLILTKALGVGIYSAAFKNGALPPTAYAEVIASTTLLYGIPKELPHQLLTLLMELNAQQDRKGREATASERPPAPQSTSA